MYKLLLLLPLLCALARWKISPQSSPGWKKSLVWVGAHQFVPDGPPGQSDPESRTYIMNIVGILSNCRVISVLFQPAMSQSSATETETETALCGRSAEQVIR